MNKRRGQYASLDVGSMGVDVSMGPITNLDNKILDEVCPDDEETVLLGKQGNQIHSATSKDGLKNPIDIMQESVESDKLVESVSEKDTKRDCNNGDEDVDEDKDIMTCKKREEELNTVVVKRRPKKNNKSNENILPPGWEKHSDENGYYYWHVKSGTIQREYPHTSMGSAMLGEEEKRELVRDVRSSIIYDDEFDANHLETALTSPQPINKPTTNQELNHSSSAVAKETQVHPQAASTSSMNSSNVSSTSTNSGLSKSCTSSSIMDIGKEKETQKRRSLPPCKENEENGSNSGSSTGVRPMQVTNNSFIIDQN